VGLIFHPRQDWIPRRQKAVEVFLKVVGDLNAVHARKSMSIG
jgi:hypothetical protein